MVRAAVPRARGVPYRLFIVDDADRRAIVSEDKISEVEQENLEALSRGTDLSPDEAWADAVAAMGPARARMFSSDADVEPVPGLGFGLGID